MFKPLLSLNLCLDTSYPELAIKNMEWKRIDSKKLNYETIDIQKISPIQLSMSIDDISDENVGSYACYVHASTGSIRQIVEINRTLDGEFTVNVIKPTKKISLAIEKTHGKNHRNREPVLGQRYEFNCISGMFNIILMMFD